MSDSMVTGRMDSSKKQRGANILDRAGLNASQAINLMYDRIIEDGNVEFLMQTPSEWSDSALKNASAFVDSLTISASSKFDIMTKAQIKADRLKSKGLI